MLSVSRWFADLSQAIRRAGLGRTSVFRRDEAGSLIVFSLFLAILLLFISGMAVDVMGYETKCVAMQNTLDTAVLAASSLNPTIDAQTLVKVYGTRAGFDADEVTVTATQSTINGQSVATRMVQTSTDVTSDTLFMDMMAIPVLTGPRASTAEEGIPSAATRPAFTSRTPTSEPARSRPARR